VIDIDRAIIFYRGLNMTRERKCTSYWRRGGRCLDAWMRIRSKLISTFNVDIHKHTHTHIQGKKTHHQLRSSPLCSHLYPVIYKSESVTSFITNKHPDLSDISQRSITSSFISP